MPTSFDSTRPCPGSWLCEVSKRCSAVRFEKPQLIFAGWWQALDCLGGSVLTSLEKSTMAWADSIRRPSRSLVVWCNSVSKRAASVLHVNRQLSLVLPKQSHLSLLTTSALHSHAYPRVLAVAVQSHPARSHSKTSICRSQ